MLLDKGADVDVRDLKGRTAFDWAKRNGKCEESVA